MMDINGVPVDNSSLFRRIIQLTCDVARRPLAGLRVLDLACAHGEFASELAARGATVVGIEGRDEWLNVARQTQHSRGLTNVEFIKDDVRNLSKAKYGEFDIVLCLGILYHLDVPDLFEFIDACAKVCTNFAIFETHFAAAPVTSREWRGHQYWGHPALEHAPGATMAEKLKSMGASLDNENSFWMTQASLWNILRHVGFTSVSDCRNPMAHLRVGTNEELKIWGSRTTLLAIKGQPVDLTMMPYATVERELDWPEDISGVLFEDVVQTLGK
jgi:SAM-dependent methyltransferase